MTARYAMALAALNGLMAVCAGAFGAHGVSDPAVRDWLRIGAEYQLVHAAAGLACIALARMMARQATIASWLFGAGGLLFGASLYALALGAGRPVGVLTPIGGVLMIAGWGVLIWGALGAREAA